MTAVVQVVQLIGKIVDRRDRCGPALASGQVFVREDWMRLPRFVVSRRQGLLKMVKRWFSSLLLECRAFMPSLVSLRYVR